MRNETQNEIIEPIKDAELLKISKLVDKIRRKEVSVRNLRNNGWEKLAEKWNKLDAMDKDKTVKAVKVKARAVRTDQEILEARAVRTDQEIMESRMARTRAGEAWRKKWDDRDAQDVNLDLKQNYP